MVLSVGMFRQDAVKFRLVLAPRPAICMIDDPNEGTLESFELQEPISDSDTVAGWYV